MFKKIKSFLELLLDIEFGYLFALGLGFLLLFYYNVLGTAVEQQFIYLAHSFLQGHLFFTDYLPPQASDNTFFNGHYFWPAGILPAVLLIPFVWLFGFTMHQGYLFFVLHIINFILLYKIAHKITSSRQTSLWLSFGFMFSTVYLFVGMFSWSWFLSQILTVTFELLAIHEFLYKKRWWLIGLFLAALVLTRANTILNLTFFLGGISLTRVKIVDKFKALTQLILPVCLAVGITLDYNFLRFGNIFERGDNFAHLGNEFTPINRSIGLWNLAHFPANLYYLFLKGLDPIFIPDTKILNFPFIKPDPWGMSIFLTSPILLWLFRASWKNNIVKLASLTSLVILFFNLGWFSIGYNQYGYRYALDFQPFLYLILCYGLQKGISKLFKWVSVTSFLVNWCLIPMAFIRIN